MGNIDLKIYFENIRNRMSSSRLLTVFVITLFFMELFLSAFRENIEIIPGYLTSGFVGSDKFEGVVFKETNGEKTFELKTNALFVAIGQLPDNSAFEGVVDLDKSGFIVADETCTTKTEGIFVAGDCRTKKIRQLTTASADGAVAALAASSYLDK